VEDPAYHRCRIRRLFSKIGTALIFRAEIGLYGQATQKEEITSGGMVLSNIGKSIRLARIFRQDGKSLMVPMESLGDRPWNEALGEVVLAGADAILVTYGILKQYYRDIVGKIPFMLTIPIDSAEQVETACRVGADAVKVHYFGPFKELPATQVALIADKCDRRGIPFLFEPVPMKENEKDLRPEVLKVAVRHGVSLGADIIKIYGEPQSFKEATKACPVPVVMAGGPVTSDRETLEMIRGAIDNGASGAAFGRRIIRHKTPGKICRAIAKIIHENFTVEQALKELI
jgi:fructose-bisphosphate aldolase/2-amino-3,7-dideoxy-D-threo-hept-6-ulosonate synthase